MSNPRLNPYPGPSPYERGRVLYGRDREKLDLLDLLIAERIVLLYSPSGAGKTSLIQAALIPALEEARFHVLPVIRVGRADRSAASSTNRYVRSALLSLGGSPPRDEQLALSHPDTGRFCDYLSQAGDATGEARRTVLIFDQFEEVLTIDPTDKTAKAEFFEQVGEALRDERRWALFAMREEFIAGLEPYLHLVPTRLSTTFRLDLLGRQAAMDAVCKPAEASQVIFDPVVAGRLVDDLRVVQVQQPDGKLVPAPGPYVEPVQLQVVCWHLWDKLGPDDTRIDDTDIRAVDDVDTVLGAYYAEKVRTIAGSTGASERAIRNWVERRLITESGLRGQAMQGEDAEQGLDNQTIRQLVDAHLVREDRRRGITWFELAHDRLVKPIRTNNESWRLAHLSKFQRYAALWDRGKRPAELLLQGQDLTDAQVWASEHASELEPHEREFLAACQEAQHAAERERRQGRRIRRLQIATIAAIIGVIAIIAAVGLYLSFRARADAKLTLSRQLAAQSLSHADDQYDLALLLALEANRVATTVDATSSLLSTLERHPNLLAFLPRDHKAAVTGVAFNPRDGTLATGSRDGSVRTWNPLAVEAGGTPLLSGAGPVTAIAYHPDGTALAVGHEDGTLDFRRLTPNLSQSQLVPAHDALIQHVAFSPDGRLLASIGKNDLALWRVTPSGLERQDRLTNQKIFSLAFTPATGALVTGHENGQVKFWSIAGERLAPIATVETGLNQVDALAVSPDGCRLAAAGGVAVDANKIQPRILLFDLERNGPCESTAVSQAVPAVLLGHHDLVESLAFSPDGRLLASGSRDKSIMIWRKSISAWDGTRLLGHLDQVLSLAFRLNCAESTGSEFQQPSQACSPLIASGDAGGNVILWDPNPDARTRLGARRLTTGLGELWSLAFSPACSPQAGTPLSSAEPPTERAPRAWCGDWLAMGSKKGSVTLWSQAAGIQVTLAPPTGLSVRSLDFSPDGWRLAAAQEDGSVSTWQAGAIEAGEPVRLVQSRDGPATGVVFSPDGRTLASGSIAGRAPMWNVALWDISPVPRAVRTLEGPGGWLGGVDMSPDGGLLAAGGGQGTNTSKLSGALLVWDMTKDQRMEPTQSFTYTNALTRIAFSPDGGSIAAGSTDGKILVWDLRDGQQQILTQHGGWVAGVAFSPAPGSSLLASGSIDNTVILWDATAGQMIGQPLRAHDNSVGAVAFSADGRWLASSDADGVVVLWDVDPASWQDQACRIASRLLTEAEWQEYVGKGDAKDQVCASR